MNILTIVTNHSAGSPHKELVNLILNGKNPFSRTNHLGHLTASGLVLKNGRVLQIFHPYIKRWFQPGGHIDTGETPIQAAVREVYEETGLLCAPIPGKEMPIDIDIHEIPANPNKKEPSHLHIDLMYHLQIVEEKKPLENIQSDWFTHDQLDSLRLKRVMIDLTSNT